MQTRRIGGECVVFRKATLLLAMLVLCFSVVAQPKVSMAQMKQKYPDANSLILSKTETLDISIKGDELDITQEHAIDFMYLNDKGLVSSSDQIPYDPNFYQITKLEASAWIPYQEGYKEKKVTEFIDVQQVDDVEFYNSQRFKQFRYAGVQAGAVTSCHYTYKMLDLYGLGYFSFKYSVPAEELIYTVITPKDVEIGVFQFGPKDFIEYTKVDKGKKTIHTWAARNVKPMKSFDFVDNDDHTTPHLFVYIKSYIVDGKRKEVQGTPAKLYQHNCGHVKDLAQEPSEEIKGVIDSIKKVNTAELEIVRGVYHWVQDHIRYIAFEEGLGGFVPRPANQVCDKKYGDCKDMANLIHSMLEYAKVPSHLCWIGTRSRGYTYDELPLGYCDNHMIAVYMHNGEPLFLDATGNEMKFGMPTNHIQGKQAMIAYDSEKFELAFVPVVPYEQSKIADTIEVVLDNANLKMVGHSILSGFIKEQIVHRVQSVDSHRENEKWLSILQRGNNKCKLESYTVHDLKNRDIDTKVEYSLVVQDYVKQINDEVYINFNFDKSMLGLRPDSAGRDVPVDYEFAYTDRSYYHMNTPIGYTIKKIPDSIKIDTPYYLFEVKYNVNGSELTVSRDFTLKVIQIPLENVKQWVVDLSKISQSYQNVVVLSKQKQ